MALKYSPETMITALRSAHGLKAVAARKLGCDRNTVDSYCKRFKTVAAVIEQERESMKDDAEDSLYQAIQDREAWAVCFFLKTQAKDRGYVERQEVTGRDGQEIAVRAVDYRQGVTALKPPEANDGDSDT